MIPPGATACAETGLREDHKRDLRLFHKMIDLETTLKAQLTTAIDSEYIEKLSDPVMETYKNDIPTILDY